MDDELARLIVNAPESSVGEVMGELNRRGAWLDKMTNKDGHCAVETRLPKRDVPDFEKWLEKITNGRATVTRMP